MKSTVKPIPLPPTFPDVQIVTDFPETGFFRLLRDMFHKQPTVDWDNVVVDFPLTPEKPDV